MVGPDWLWPHSLLVACVWKGAFEHHLKQCSLNSSVIPGPSVKIHILTQEVWVRPERLHFSGSQGSAPARLCGRVLSLPFELLGAVLTICTVAPRHISFLLFQSLFLPLTRIAVAALMAPQQSRSTSSQDLQSHLQSPPLPSKIMFMGVRDWDLGVFGCHYSACHGCPQVGTPIPAVILWNRTSRQGGGHELCMD